MSANVNTRILCAQLAREDALDGIDLAKLGHLKAAKLRGRTAANLLHSAINQRYRPEVAPFGS